jgi:hypothetical protein
MSCSKPSFALTALLYLDSLTIEIIPARFRENRREKGKT